MRAHTDAVVSTGCLHHPWLTASDYLDLLGKLEPNGAVVSASCNLVARQWQCRWEQITGEWGFPAAVTGASTLHALNSWPLGNLKEKNELVIFNMILVVDGWCTCIVNNITEQDRKIDLGFKFKLKYFIFPNSITFILIWHAFKTMSVEMAKQRSIAYRAACHGDLSLGPTYDKSTLVHGLVPSSNKPLR